MTHGIFCVLLALFLQGTLCRIEVTVKQGKVIGTRSTTVFERKLHYVFYGVPYAKPPINRLRFKNPRSWKKWDKPHDARTPYYGTCPQAHIVHKHGLFGTEDCLRMNIYTPNLPQYNYGKINLKPVLVWIHGFGFTSSFSHLFGGDLFVNHEIIVISVTHRIGVFGFLKINDTDSNVNMGLRDIIMALKWIKQNIKAFGGDKNNVTVMGSSSGSTFLSLLLMTKFKRLFSKMILQSGALYSPSIFQKDSVLEKERLKEELIKLTQNDLYNAPVKHIIQASRKVQSKKEVMNFQRSIVPFSPLVEPVSRNAVIIKTPDEFYKNAENINMPMLVGFNTQESISEVIPFLQHPHYLKYFSSHFKFMVPFSNGCKYRLHSNTYNNIASKIKTYYFKTNISEQSLEIFLKYVSDLNIFPVYKFIHTQLRYNKNKMFVYKFNYNGKFNSVKATSIAEAKIKVRGAAIGDELCYMLRCEPLWENYAAMANNSNKDKDKHFMTDITSYWASFIKNGDPSSFNLNRNHIWPEMTLKRNDLLLFDQTIISTHSKSEENMFAFWNNLYDEYYEKCEGQHDEL